MSISVIIAAYNEGSEVAATVESVLSNTRDLREVLVVDDASSDGSCEGLEGNCVRVVRNEERRGVAPSRARGAEGVVHDLVGSHHGKCFLSVQGVLEVPSSESWGECSGLGVNIDLLDTAGLSAQVAADPASFGFTNLTDPACIGCLANE